jgi:Skp family chaperone for outer membrane proteins
LVVWPAVSGGVGLILGRDQHCLCKEISIPGTILQGVQSNNMTRQFVRLLTIAAFALSMSSFAQSSEAASATPDAPSAAIPTAPTASGTKLGTINIEQAIFATNEGQRDFEALSKKLEPKQTQLKGESDELDSLKKQLDTQGDKLNETARGALVKEIEQKQKSFDREVQDARDDAQSQQNEIAQKILQKMAPIIVKYAGDNGFGIIMDTSNPWPQGQVLWADPNRVDITKAVVDTYNLQSGVAAPAARPAASRPAAPTKPAGSATGKP